MPASAPQQSAKNDPVGLQVAEFERRYPDFERARQSEMRMLKHDFVARWFSEHLIMGNKSMFDSMLQAMLTDKEHQLLETDAEFTKAWRIFVDLCWLRRQLARAGIILGAILLVMGIALFCFWALPRVAGPGDRPYQPY